MSWKTRDAMQEKIRFVVRASEAGSNVSALCREFDISRPTGYYWLKRYRETRSFGSLIERSRRPHESPQATDERIQQRVVQLRERYGWGGKKLQVLLAQEGVKLSVPTVNRILKRRGMIRKEDSHRAARKRFERSTPNELWQMDFKGEFHYREGICYPLSILDDHSRFMVGLHALESVKLEGVQRAVRTTFSHYGIPQALLMDHGVPWWSTTNGYGLTRFSVDLIRQGIQLIYSGIGHPQTQGKVERFHRTLSDRISHQGRPESLSQWEQWIREFRHEYNTIRPHEALGMEPPVRRYQPSLRPYQDTPPPWDYNEGLQVKRLNSQGCLSHGGRYYFVCEALTKRRVGIEILDGKILVRYRHMYVREIDLRTRQTRALVCLVQN